MDAAPSPLSLRRPARSYWQGGGSVYPIYTAPLTTAHNMKYPLITALILASLCTACQRALPPVPDNGRVVVQPKGSTDIVKPWNGTTRQEGDAVLGPLSNARR